jgi:hypothetical protein
MFIAELATYPSTHELSAKICWGEHGEESAKVWFTFRTGDLKEVYPEENFDIPTEVLVDAKRQVMYDLSRAYFDAQETKRKHVASFEPETNEEDCNGHDQGDGQVVGAVGPASQLRDASVGEQGA